MRAAKERRTPRGGKAAPKPSAHGRAAATKMAKVVKKVAGTLVGKLGKTLGKVAGKATGKKSGKKSGTKSAKPSNKTSNKTPNKTPNKTSNTSSKTSKTPKTGASKTAKVADRKKLVARATGSGSKSRDQASPRAGRAVSGRRSVALGGSSVDRATAEPVVAGGDAGVVEDDRHPSEGPTEKGGSSAEFLPGTPASERSDAPASSAGDGDDSGGTRPPLPVPIASFTI